MKNISLSVFLILFSLPFLSAQDDNLGNWIMYFGQNRITDKLSIHSEIQYRNHTVSPTNIEQLLIRTGLNFHLKKNLIVTAGYGLIPSYVFDSPQKEAETLEHRIFQQLILTNTFDHLKFEHRYRIEQRWVNDDYKNRLRYRLMAFIPVNNKTMGPKTFFIGLYDEVFMNTKSRFFDRNRLYGGIGYQFNSQVNVQTGLLYQQLPTFGKYYLQFAFTYNPDFRKPSE